MNDVFGFFIKLFHLKLDVLFAVFLAWLGFAVMSSFSFFFFVCNFVNFFFACNTLLFVCVILTAYYICCDLDNLTPLIRWTVVIHMHPKKSDSEPALCRLFEKGMKKLTHFGFFTTLIQSLPVKRLFPFIN